MDDLQQQKAQIDEETKRIKEEADRKAGKEKQALADQEAERIRREADEKANKIQNDAQK